MKNVKLITALSMIAFLLATAVYSSTPNPGHSANQIGSGTFNGTTSDVWSFPGNVGIGTTTPGQLLHLSKAGTAGVQTPIMVLESATSLRPLLQFSENGAAISSGMSIEYDGRGSGANNLLYINNVSGGPVVTFMSGGNVGIGTTGPRDTLDLHANDRGLMFSLPTSSTVTLTSYQGYISNNIRPIGIVGSTVALFTGATTGSTSTARLYIDSTGNVGIGTTNPGNSLVVAKPSASNFLQINRDSTSYEAGMQFTQGATNEWWLGTRTASPNTALHLFSYQKTSGASDVMVIDKEGNVGIGTTAPTYQLQLSTDSAAKPGTSAWTIASDARIKTDIRPFSDGLSVIDNIDPVWYQYNGKGGFAADGKEYIGVLAQDIERVAPYTVGTYKAKLNANDTNETELLNFNSHALTFVLINSVKELKKENEELKALVCLDHPSAEVCRG